MEAESDQFATWSGELYFELHRGTYTTHAEVKRANRELELLLREAELWCSVRPDPWANYPAAELDVAWKELLTHQFHDILPGTSINWVYADTAAAHARVREVASAAVDRALAALAATVDTDGTEQPILLFNAAPADRQEVVVIDGGAAVVAVVGPDGEAGAVQRLHDGRAAFVASLPALGYARYDLRTGGGWFNDPRDVVEAGDGFVDNGVLRVGWDGDGVLTSVFGREAGRELVARGQRLHVLQLLDGRPNRWAAWDCRLFT